MMALPVVGALAVINVFIHMSHGHHDDHDRVKFPYEHKLVKQYPWSPHECNFMDYECKDRVRAAAKGGIVKGH